MTTTPSFSHVHVASIDLADKKYMLSPQDEPADKSIVSSISEHGLLHPPLVIEIQAGQFIIVSGRKRVRAFLQTHSPDSLLCLVMPAESTDLQIYSLLLEHSLMDGPLSIAEQTAFFEKLGASCSSEDALPFLIKLGYKANRHKLDELLEMRNLSSVALQVLHDGILKYNNARKMLKLSKDDQTSIVEIIKQLHLGGSKQQRLITLSTELIMRRKKELKIIMQDSPFSESSEKGHQANVPQQAAALLQWLHLKCFPRLAEAEAEFKKRLTLLDLPPDMQVHHTQAFEDNGLILSIHLTDWDRLQQTVQKITPPYCPDPQTTVQP